MRGEITFKQRIFEQLREAMENNQIEITRQDDFLSLVERETGLTQHHAQLVRVSADDARKRELEKRQDNEAYKREYAPQLFQWVFESEIHRHAWNPTRGQCAGRLAIGTVGLDRNTGQRWTVTEINFIGLMQRADITWARLKGTPNPELFREPQDAFLPDPPLKAPAPTMPVFKAAEQALQSFQRAQDSLIYGAGANPSTTANSSAASSLTLADLQKVKRDLERKLSRDSNPKAKPEPQQPERKDRLISLDEDSV